MLQRLIIKNFAIIESADIEFSEGLNIITGETGSGKSLIVNAIDLLMGAKFSKQNFRNKEEILVMGYFKYNGREIEVKRKFHFSGKHKTFINDNQITNQELRQATMNYIDMHGQFNQHSIFNKLMHINYLDDFGDYSSLLTDISNIFLNYEKNKKKLIDLNSINEDIVNKRELYEYQLAELNEINIYHGIDNELSKRYDKISNIEEIKKSIENAIHSIENRDNSLKFEISRILKIFNRLTAIDEDYAKFVKIFESMGIDIDEMAYDLSLKKNEYIFDQEEFDKISDNLEKVQMIKKKYGGTIEAAILHKDKIEKYLNDFSSVENQISILKKSINEDEKKLKVLADKISKKRIDNIPVFEKKINSILQSLNMEDAVFSVSLTEADNIYEKGSDFCEFHIRTNKGSKMKPVIKIASGGEVSRIMLAIKILMQQKIKKNTLIFDEIDLGVSGKAAENLGDNLLKLSDRTQVICISHLPQVASKGVSHYKVFKKTNKNLTISNVVRLNSHSRIDEIAQMLSGKELTENSLNQAKYLLEI